MENKITRRRSVPPVRRARRGALIAFGVALVLMAWLVGLLLGPLPQAEPVETPVHTPVIHILDEPPEEPEEEEYNAEDVRLLAKIMDAEDGYNWPDAMILCIGEVVLNRVASPEFPDTVREVLYQADGGYVQYAPVHSAAWATSEPTEHYVELAKRLLDGERVLNDPAIIYQALFEQGRGTVMTYHDFYLGSTTYFCLTEKPGLYV